MENLDTRILYGEKSTPPDHEKERFSCVNMESGSEEPEQRTESEDSGRPEEEQRESHEENQSEDAQQEQPKDNQNQEIQEDAPSIRLFIANIPESYNESDVSDLLNKYGTTNDIYLIRRRGRFTGQVKAGFKPDQTMDELIAKMSEVELNGQKLRVEQGHTQEQSKNIKMRHLEENRARRYRYEERRDSERRRYRYDDRDDYYRRRDDDRYSRRRDSDSDDYYYSRRDRRDDYYRRRDDDDYYRRRDDDRYSRRRDDY